MTIKTITLATITMVTLSTYGADPRKQRPQSGQSFVNNGALVNNKKFTHYGPFVNNGVVLNQGTFQTGIPPYPHYQYQQAHYAQTAYYYPMAGQPQHLNQMPPCTPVSYKQVAAKNRPLTPEEQATIKEIEQFSQFTDLLPKNLKNAVTSATKLTGPEQAAVATSLQETLHKNETARDIKNVLMPIFDKEDNSKTMSPEKKSTSKKLLTPNEQNPSLFFFNPNPTLPQPSDKPLFFTQEKPQTDRNSSVRPFIPFAPEASQKTGIAPSVCDQLKLTDDDKTKTTWNMALSQRRDA